MYQLRNLIILLVGTLVIISCNSEGEATMLSSPLALKADNIKGTSFTANWVGVNNAEGYMLDVSRTNDFSDFVQGYHAKEITDLKEEVTGLTWATDYHYRVRAFNGDTESGNSNVVKLTTSAPTNTTLKEAAKGFYIGTAIQANKLTGGHDVVLKKRVQ